MRTDEQTIRGHEIVRPHVDLEGIKERAKRAFTKERIADVVVCASTVTVLGMVLHMLHSALESYTIVPF